MTSSKRNNSEILTLFNNTKIPGYTTVLYNSGIQHLLKIPCILYRVFYFKPYRNPIFTQIYPKLRLYTKWAKIKPISETSTF